MNYNKVNNGVTCTDYETAMNITFDKYNDLYLIKEQKIDCLVTHVVLTGLLFQKLFYMVLI